MEITDFGPKMVNRHILRHESTTIHRIDSRPLPQEGTLNIIQKETSKTIARGSNAQLELADLAGCFEYRPWRAYMSQQRLLATSLIPGCVGRGGQVRI